MVASQQTTELTTAGYSPALAVLDIDPKEAELSYDRDSHLLWHHS